MVHRSSNSCNACALCTVQPQFLWKGAITARGNCHSARANHGKDAYRSNPSVPSTSLMTVLLYRLYVSLVAQQYATVFPAI